MKPTTGRLGDDSESFKFDSDVHESLRQKSTAVLKSLDLGAVLAISANNTENSRIN